MMSSCIILAPANIESGDIYEVPVNATHKYFYISTSAICLLQQVIIPTSCIVNSSLYPTGKVYLLTPFDPLFLILPALFQRPDAFYPLQDLCNDSKARVLAEINAELFRLERICDVKMFEGNLYVRVDKEKFKNWVKEKYENLAREIAIKVLWADATFDSGENSKKTSLGILMDFLDFNIISSLNTSYTLDMILSVGRVARRLTHDDSRPGVIKKKEPVKKEIKLSKSQSTLASFFKKKNK